MNPQILDALKTIGDKAVLHRYFDGAAQLIDALELADGDKRLAFTAPRDIAGLRVNINDRLAYAIQAREDGEDWLFMISLDDLHELANDMSLKQAGESFAGTDNMVLSVLTSSEITDEGWRTVLDCCVMRCKEYLATRSGSIHQHHHQSELYQMAVDKAYRLTVFDEVTVHTDAPDEEYFDLDGMSAFAPFAGKQYDKDSDAADWYKDTHNKFDFLVSLLSNRLKVPLKVSYIQNPAARAGRGQPPKFRDYVLRGFTKPPLFENKWVFIKLMFCHLDNDVPNFVIEVDINDKDDDNAFRRQRDELNDSSWSIPVNDSFPKNWKDLLSLIEPQVTAKLRELENAASGNYPIQFEFQKHTDKQMDINTILFGPPGTGKTYNTIDKVCELLDFKSKLVDATDKEKRLEMHEFVDMHTGEQVEFITFHQSLSYEDFIEGIKPETNGKQVVYPTKAGVFTRIAYRALQNIYQNYRKKDSVDFTTVYKAFIADVQRKAVTDPFVFTSMSGSRIRYNTMWKGDTTMEVFFEYNSNAKKGAPGTEPFRVRMEKIKALYEHGIPKVVKSLKNEIAPIVKYNEPVYYAVYKEFLTFLEVHYPNLTIQELPQKAEVTVAEDTQPEDLNYSTLLNQLSDLLTPEDKKNLKANPYVLIIDEINRGNVSQIFGELITLLEADKRFTKDEAMKLTLSYSGSEFSVPPNLYIIGTMNTADRSVEALDTALRRRFTFEEKAPRPNILSADVDGINLQRLLATMNERLELLIDRDHTIGHAWLMGCNTVNEIANKFEMNILPLLREYFYNDYSKIGLVLGDEFVKQKEDKKDTAFASFKGISKDIRKELMQRPQYDIAVPQYKTPVELVTAFQSVYNGRPPVTTMEDNG